MLCVLEGVDLGGKTTLTRQLVSHHGERQSTVLHQGAPPPGDLVEHYERPLLEHDLRKRILDPDHLVVLDRWEVGELVYGPLWRGESRLSPGQALHVDLLLRSLGAVRVLAQPRNVETVFERYDRIGDELLSRDDVRHVHSFYEYHGAANSWERGDGCDPDRVIAAASRCNDDALALTSYPGYVGYRYPTTLYVGERRANTRSGKPLSWTDKAFTPTGGLSCSRWLLDAIDARGHTLIGLVNAYEPELDLRALWKTLDEPAVVALGALAARELTRLELPHGRVAHPQYARRFRYKDPNGYADELIEEARRQRWEKVDGQAVRVLER